MNYSTAQLNVKYQIVIPKAIREVVSLEPNERLGIFTTDKNTIILKKVPRSINEFKGSCKFPKDYLHNERLSW